MIDKTAKKLAKDYLREGREKDQEISRLKMAIRETIMENLHLADGENCTFKRLKDAIKFELPQEP